MSGRRRGMGATDADSAWEENAGPALPRKMSGKEFTEKVISSTSFAPKSPKTATPKSVLANYLYGELPKRAGKGKGKGKVDSYTDWVFNVYGGKTAACKEFAKVIGTEDVKLAEHYTYAAVSVLRAFIVEKFNPLNKSAEEVRHFLYAQAKKKQGKKGMAATAKRINGK